MKNSTAYGTIVTLSAVAFANAAYLTNQAFAIRNGAGFDSFCDINSKVSCGNVLAHPLSQVFGIPFPTIALFVYPVLLALAAWGWKKDDARFFRPLAVLSAMGTAFNSFIIYREAFFIGAYCLLCLLCSAIIVSILAISASRVRKKA